MIRRSFLAMIAAWLVVLCTVFSHRPARALEPIPDKLVVLSFDDSVKSQYTVARPLLKKYGFGATFFVCEGFNFHTNKTDYMTWDEIKALHDDGFEIGNHTRDHMGVNSKNYVQLPEQLEDINTQCRKMGIPSTTSFAWPANFIAREALPVLKKHGIRFGRRGAWPELPPSSARGFAYEPGRDHPLLIPSTGIPQPGYTLENFTADAAKARDGRIAVFTFHGVPEGEHEWVNTPEEQFAECMKHLHDHGYKVIAFRDLAHYVDPENVPADAWDVINARKQAKAKP